MGVEPINIQILSLTPLPIGLHSYMVGSVGIEPTSMDLQSTAMTTFANAPYVASLRTELA